MTNRRQFLETLAAAAAASLVPSSGVFGRGRVAKLNVPGGATNRPWSPQMSLEQMDKFGIGVAHATFPWPYAAMMAFMPESQILFGTDCAPEPVESTVDQLAGLKLPRAFEQMMLRGNAERLFPRFKLA
jgi:hypothetical protein